MAKKDRFEIVYRQGLGFGTSVKILRDKETGVHYMCHIEGYSGGITPLLDKAGKPVVTTGSHYEEQR